MTARRLPVGGRIDRTQIIPFTWNGTPMIGHPNDTLASALLANGVQLVGRSFKYHRPRGIMSAGVEESGALVTIGEGAYRDPNCKATMQELYPGLVASSQNAWPNVHFDIGSISNLFSRFLSAGFYYKTFMGPQMKWLPEKWHSGTKWWMQYEKLIRKAAGMGEASRLADADHYDHGHDFCDVLVIGGGPAGLSAAATAAKAGLDVLLVEQTHEFGGNLLSQSTPEAQEILPQLLSQLHASDVRTMIRTAAFGLYDGGVAGLLERVTDHLPSTDNNHAARFLPRQRFWMVRAKHIIVATGALEQHIAFGNNDRPGVMTAAAGQTYLNRYGILPGKQIVIATNNDSAYQVAADLADAGAEVALLDARRAVNDALHRFAKQHKIPVQMHSAPLEVHGGKRVKSLDVAEEKIGDHDERWVYAHNKPCDLVLISGGWAPMHHLLSHRGGRPIWNAELACFLPPESNEPISIAGAAAGIWNTDSCEASGKFAATRAVNALGKTLKITPAPKLGGWQNPIRPLYEVKVAGRNAKALVDPQHDVTTDDIRLAWREGFVSVEHLKRYTTLGMATDGGKMGNVIGLAIMANALGKEIPEVGTTTYRPPHTPVAIGALRGRSVNEHFRPLRRTPMHQWNLDNGATMTMAGLWHRPWYFAGANETLEQAYIREATIVRHTVGLCDVTSLGKIAIQGADATEFLNRIYTSPFAKLPIGKARYGIMLRDDGIVFDDGTTWRLSETEYFMTTTTANAATVMAWLEELLQTRWQTLKVQVTSVSDQWGGCAVAGPKSRATVSACVDTPERVSSQSLPFMGVIETTLKGGIPCRIARISFSGEMAFEVYVPSDYATAMIDLLWTTAKTLGGCLYGLEALGTLRIEKGHVTGAELDGRVTIDDAGLGNMASANKSFIGSTLRQRPELQRTDRPQLVGIYPKNRRDTFNAGSLLCRAGQVMGHGEGWITAITHSPALGHFIGIGFIAGGHENWRGQTVTAADPVRNSEVEVEIVSPHMFDPSGERMHA